MRIATWNVNSVRTRAERIAAFALVRARNGALEEIVEKPSAEVVRAAGPHAPVSMNAFRFTPEIFAACRRITPSPRGEVSGNTTAMPASAAQAAISRRRASRARS